MSETTDITTDSPPPISAPPQARRVGWPGFLLAIPAWAWWAVFFVVPVVLVIAASFGSKVPNSAGRVSYSNLSLDNYREALDGGLDGTFFKVLVQGMRTTVLGTVLCLIIAFPLAYLLAVKMHSRKGLVLGLLAIPFFTNFLIRTLAWRIVLAPKGLISNTLNDWGVLSERLDLLNTRMGVQIGVVYNYLPLMIFPLFVALDRLDPAHREASKDLFAGRLRTFTQITLPLARPGIIAGVVLVFVPLAGDYITANLLGGAKGNMPGNLVASQFTQSQNPSLGAALAVVLVFGILGIMGLAAGLGILLRLIGREVSSAGMALGALTAVVVGVFAMGDTVWSPVRLVQADSLPTVLVILGLLVAGAALLAALPRPFDVMLLGLWSTLVMIFLYIPIAFIVGHSFNDNRALEVWSRFSTRWYGEMWDNTQMTSAVKNSFIAAAVAAMISVIIGTLAGIALARRPGKWTVAFMALLLLVLTTPEIVDATGMQLQFVWFSDVEVSWLGGDPLSIFREGLFPLFIGQSIFSAAVVTLIVRARMQGMDESLEQAAADLFATPLTAFRQITMPLISPAVMAGGLLAFTFALDNVIISDFVRGNGANTFPTYVFGLAKTVMKPDVAAMATLLLGITLAALIGAALILRRSGDDSSQIAATLTGS